MREQEVETLITADGRRIILPTSEEDAAINAQIAADPDDFELDEEWFKNAKSTKELFPETYRWAMQRKADLEAGVIQEVRITLPANVVDWFKAQCGLDGETGGTAWIDLIEQTLQAHVSAWNHSQLPPVAGLKRLQGDSTQRAIMVSRVSNKRRSSDSSWPFGSVDDLSKQEMDKLPKRQKIHLKQSRISTRCGYFLDDFLYSDNLARVTCLRCQRMELGDWPAEN